MHKVMVGEKIGDRNRISTTIIGGLVKPISATSYLMLIIMILLYIPLTDLLIY